MYTYTLYIYICNPGLLVNPSHTDDDESWEGRKTCLWIYIYMYIYIYIYIYILMALTGKFCSLNQFFRGHFACRNKSMSPKSLFLNVTSYGENLLAVIVYHVVLSMDG